MKKKGSPVQVIWDIFKYKKQEYSFFYVALFLCVTFEVVGVTRSFSVTDILYLIFAFIFLFKGLKPNYVGKHIDVFFYPAAFIMLAFISYNSYGAGRMFQSELRFIYNCVLFAIIFHYFKACNIRDRDKLIFSYIYVCVLASTFIVIQYLSFYIFHYTIKYDLGDFNAASTYIYTATEMYRTGGIFNEPSWFALFTGPVLEIAYRKKKIPELMICIIGIVLSTSSMGFLFLAIFGVTKIKDRNFKALIITLFVIITVYYFFPQAFNRIFESLKFESGENTNDARVLSPFAYAFSSKPTLFGTDVSDVIGVSLFLNTFVFVLLAFGVVGLAVFMIMIWQRKDLCLSLIILSGIIIEGCYGRVDFWMALLAASVYSYNNRIIMHNKETIPIKKKNKK